MSLHRIFLACAIIYTTTAISQQNNEELIKYVKPEIGLDNGGNVIPGPSLPSEWAQKILPPSMSDLK